MCVCVLERERGVFARKSQAALASGESGLASGAAQGWSGTLDKPGLGSRHGFCTDLWYSLGFRAPADVHVGVRGWVSSTEFQS